MSVPCFVPADILLPAANISLDPWACIAVDQFTSQPEYWQRAEELAAGKPSTLHIVLPEAYLGTPQEEERMQTIRRTMQEYPPRPRLCLCGAHPDGRHHPPGVGRCRGPGSLRL